MTIGSRLKYARQEHELSQEKLAELVGVTRGACGQWENGRSKPSVEHLSKLAKALGVRFDWLATGRGEMKFFASDEQLVTEPSAEYSTASEQQELLSLFYKLPDNKRLAILNLLRTM